MKIHIKCIYNALHHNIAYQKYQKKQYDIVQQCQHDIIYKIFINYAKVFGINYCLLIDMSNDILYLSYVTYVITERDEERACNEYGEFITQRC